MPHIEYSNFYRKSFGSFGMLISERSSTFGSKSYRFGFNGMEEDNSNSYTTTYRQYNARIGKWFSVDPQLKKYPSYSSYLAFSNRPIIFVDPKGDDGWDIAKGVALGLLDNQTGGFGYVRNWAFSIESNEDYNAGLRMADHISIAIGKILLTSGAGALTVAAVMAEAGIAAELATAGGATVVVAVEETIAGVIAVAGALSVAEGALLATTGITGLANKRGHLESTSTKSSQKGGGKNSKHSSEKKRQAAKEKYEKAKQDYDAAKSKPNKTKEDKSAIEKLKKARDAAKRKMDDTGENHSQKGKGSK